MIAGPFVDVVALWALIVACSPFLLIPIALCASVVGTSVARRWRAQRLERPSFLRAVHGKGEV